MRAALVPRLPLATAVAAAVAVGLGVALGARAFANGSCPSHESVALVSTCRGLIASLAARVGVTAGVVVLLAQLVSAGLTRTAEAIDRDRELAREEER